MKKRKFKQGLAITMALFMTINSVSVGGPWKAITSYAETTAKVNATTLNVRSGPGTTYSIVGKVTNGTLVSVTGTTTGSDGKTWNQISFTGSGGNQATGYVMASYLKAPTAYTSDMNFESYLTEQGFPESYKAGLRQLHAEYPNWVFTAQHTNLDWETVISNESVVGRNLVYSSSLSSWKSTADGAYDWDTSTWPGFDSSSYVAASEDIIRYYMDPRNFLDDKYVFQFLLHTYDSSAQTAEGLQSMVKDTFLSGSASVSGNVSGVSGTGGSSGGPGEVGPGVSGTSGSSSSSASLTGPGGTSGNSSTSNSGSSSGGASLTGPGSTSGNNSTSNSGSSLNGVSLTGPGGASGNNSTSSGGNSLNGVSLTSPGSTSGTGGTSGGGSSSSGVSLTAPGSLSSTKEINGVGSFMPGASISKKETTRVATAIGPGMTGGPGGSSSSDSSGSPTPSGGPGVSSSSGGTASYVDIIMNAGAQTGVNPYVLAAMILQEQGNSGTGRSISGTVAGYTGYYNFFNIEAYQSGSMDAVSRGLWYASQSGSYGRPWNSVDRSILGGASYYATNYVNAGQDTFYLKKFNVQGSNLYKHQYMTNIQGAASEGAKLAEAYGSELKKTALEFKIPVYQNMPETACAKPTTDGSPNNKLSGLGVDGFAITPTFNRDTTSYDLIVDPSVSEITINAVPLSSTASISGTGTIQLQSGNNEIKVSVTAQNGSVREYLIHVVRQDNGPTHNSALGSGINGSGSGNSGYGPGYSSVGAGPGTGSGTGPGVSSGSSGTVSQPSSGGAAGTGPSGSSQSQAVSGTGPGQSNGGSSSENTGGPGGSNVTIVR